MKDNVWFTYKARIKAQERLEWMDFHSQNLLVWYAILSAVVATLTIRYPDLLGKDTDLLTTVLSIFLLAISLSVANRDFRGRAILMRRNYQRLHRLYSTMNGPSASPAEIETYSNLLRDCENHKSIDDILARIGSNNLTSREPSTKEVIVGYGVLIRRYALTGLLYIAPVIVAASFWIQSQ
ncbi:SLATT domain-containing protein [Xanthomonas sp. D-93]|nr:SLATT domain-containing protein [Xanthomonas sp. D-93]